MTGRGDTGLVARMDLVRVVVNVEAYRAERLPILVLVQAEAAEQHGMVQAAIDSQHSIDVPPDQGLIPQCNATGRAVCTQRVK